MRDSNAFRLALAVGFAVALATSADAGMFIAGQLGRIGSWRWNQPSAGRRDGNSLRARGIHRQRFDGSEHCDPNLGCREPRLGHERFRGFRGATLLVGRRSFVGLRGIRGCQRSRQCLWACGGNLPSWLCHCGLHRNVQVRRRVRACDGTNLDYDSNNIRGAVSDGTNYSGPRRQGQAARHWRHDHDARQRDFYRRRQPTPRPSASKTAISTTRRERPATGAIPRRSMLSTVCRQRRTPPPRNHHWPLQ